MRVDLDLIHRARFPGPAVTLRMAGELFEASDSRPPRNTDQAGPMISFILRTTVESTIALDALVSAAVIAAIKPHSTTATTPSGEPTTIADDHQDPHLHYDAEPGPTDHHRPGGVEFRLHRDRFGRSTTAEHHRDQLLWTGWCAPGHRAGRPPPAQRPRWRSRPGRHRSTQLSTDDRQPTKARSEATAHTLTRTRH